MKTNDQLAEELMEAKQAVWDKLNICCGASSLRGNKIMGYSVGDKKTEHDNLLISFIKKLGYSEKKKVTDAVRQIIENENHHTLNRVLQENNLGEGNY